MTEVAGIRPAAWAQAPLRFVFWGSAIFCLQGMCLGFGAARELAAALVLIGTVLLVAGRSSDRVFRAAMAVVVLVAAVHVSFFVLRDSAPLRASPVVYTIYWTVILLTPVAAVVYCLAMRRLASSYGLWRSASSWLVTALLALVCYTLPATLLPVLVIVGFPRSSVAGVFPAAWPFVRLLQVVPLVHLAVSSWRTCREIGDGSGHAAFPVIPFASAAVPPLPADVTPLPMPSRPDLSGPLPDNRPRR